MLADPAELAALEAIVHPAVHHERTRFIVENGDAPALLFDIPLLFETGGDDAFDKVIVVSAPADVQRARVLARPGMTAEKLDAILARQMPDAEKRERADFVVDTSGDLSTTEAQVRDILACLGLGGGRIIAAMREIVFDTETTGLNPAGGDRMVEIGCVEMFNRIETGRHFHAYFNPERTMPFGAEAVHGLSDVFLSDKPRFSRAGRGAARLHRGFAAGRAQRRLRFQLPQPRAVAVRPARRCAPAGWSTRWRIARTRHPGAKHSLDALCMRFGVDRSQRIKHGALLDAQLLAQVYIELTGGRQIGLGLVADTEHGRHRRRSRARSRSASRASRGPHSRAG